MKIKNIIFIFALFAILSFGYSAFTLMQNGSFETADINYQNPNIAVSHWNIVGSCGASPKYIMHRDGNAHVPFPDANVGFWELRGYGNCTYNRAYFYPDQNFTLGTIRFAAKTLDSDCHEQINLYKDISGSLTSCGATGNLTTAWTQYEINYCGNDANLVLTMTGSGGVGCGVYEYGNTLIDNVQYQPSVSLQNEITEPTEPVQSYSDFNILVKIKENGSYITDATVRLIFNNTSYQTISYNSSIGYYVYSNSGQAAGDYNFAVLSSKGTDVNAYNEGTITIRDLLPGNLSITDISNISHTINNFNVDLNPTSESSTFIFEAKNNYIGSLTVDYNIFNSLDDGRQYFIYTSSDGNNYSFNDSLTYGGTEPIQKIWNNELEKYIYSFIDILAINETKYYKLTYKLPAKYWKNLENSPEWFNQLQPNVIPTNGQNVDVYAVSNFSNLRNYLIEPLPVIDQTGYRNFAFQFTAWSDQEIPTVTLKVGKIRNGDITTLTNISSIVLNRSPTRYSVDIFALNSDDQIILSTDVTTGKQFYVLDYALINRGYFTKKLDLKDAAGNDLPLIVWGTNFYKYVKEGKTFRGISEAYDREGDVNSIGIEAYLDTTADANEVKHYYYDVSSGTETTIPLNYLINQIVDLNGSAATQRMLRVKFTLYDINNVAISTQSEWVKFLQFPYFKEDFSIYAVENDQKVGNSPNGSIFVNTIAPENFLGVKIKIWDDSNSYASPTYAKTIYADSFNCQFGECSIEYNLTDFAFSKPGFYHMAFIGLLSTEYESLAQDSNNAIYYLDVLVFAKEFKVARVFQMRERTADPSLYNNTEKIPFVMELQDEELRNLKNEINVYAYLATCTTQTGNDCTLQNKKIYPNSFLYDDKTGYNYYFFNQYLTTANGSLLPDGNYIRFYGVITLINYDYNYYYLPLLAKKCKSANYNLSNFQFNALGIILDYVSSLATGCTAGNYQDKIVAFGFNQDQEDRIKIDNNYTPTAPTQEAFVCINADENNIYVNSFKQRLLCAVVGTIGEREVDKLKLTITNNNSDLSATQYKQYVDLQIPYEYLIYQQPQLLKTFLETNRHTQITTVGDALAEGFNWIGTGYLNTGISVIDATNLKNSMTNIGYDTNFSKLFSPTNVNFIFFYIIDGLKVVNVKDYFSDNTVQNPTNFIRYASENSLFLPKDDETTITILGSDMQPIYTTKQNGYLVINESAKKSNIKTQTDINAAYQTAPNILQFNLISDLYYNNNMDSIRRYVPLTVKAIITKKFNINDVAQGISDFVNDPVGAFIDFMFSNILIISVVLMILVIFAYIAIMVRGRQ